MNIFYKDNLNSSDQLQLKLLLKDQTDQFLDADGWWFAASDPDLSFGTVLISEPCLAGCMAVYQTGDDCFECVPFVRPDMREKGIFASILAKACEEGNIPGEGSVYFSCNPENDLWQNVLEHIGAEHVWDEYIMERELTEIEETVTEKNSNEKTANTVLCQILENTSANGENIDENAAEDSTTWRAIGCRSLLNQNTTSNLTADLAANQTSYLTADQAPDQPTVLTAPEVACLLAPQGQSVYLYSLEVLPELRNKHLGTAFLSALLPQLAEKGFKTIKLQVSSENLPAMALYKKTWFHITQTLFFYEY